MGRYATLNPETKDLVNCLLPAVASQFRISDPVDIIPEDIRMRQWDCERRDHIKDQTEDDPRNWGVQFLKDLMAISRLKEGNLAEFQADLRAKVAKHESRHPWARLADIKELKEEYENPDGPVVESQKEYSSDGGTSTDSYLEELVEEEIPRGTKRRRRPRNHEAYQARVQPSAKRRKYGRLRRSEEGGYHRKDKYKHHNKDRYPASSRSTPSGAYASMRRPGRVIVSSPEGSVEPTGMSGRALLTPSFTGSASPSAFGAFASIAHSVDNSDQPLEVQGLQAQLDIAEAELKAARLKMAYIEAKRRIKQEASDADYEGVGTEQEPCMLN